MLTVGVFCQAMMRGDLDILQDWCHEAVCTGCGK